MKLTDEVKKRFEYRYKVGKTPWMRPAIEDDIKEFAKMAKKEFRGGKVLDLGCGTGWLSIYLAKQGFKVKGIDSAPTAIKRAKEAARKAKAKADFKAGDALDFKYGNHEFDIVIDRGMLHHVPEKEWSGYKKGIMKILKPNGLFYLMVFSDKSKKKGFNPKSGRMWRRVKEEGGQWAYDHFFNKAIVMKTFGKNFKMINFDKEAKASPQGSLLLYFTLRKLN